MTSLTYDNNALVEKIDAEGNVWTVAGNVETHTATNLTITYD